MTGITRNTTLPVAHLSRDWNAFYDEFPPPDVFERTTWKWSRARLRLYQEMRFRRILSRAQSNLFYQRLWARAGIDPSEVRSLRDISALPAFDADALRGDQEEAPPFGSLQKDLVDERCRVPLKIQTSGGTTGVPRPMVFGPVEWEMQALASARSLHLLGARPGDILQIPVTCALADLGWAFYKAAHDILGVVPITSGSGQVTATRRQLEIARSWGTTLWVSFPEYLAHLGQVAREELGWEVRELRTKFLLTFLGPDVDGTLRRELEGMWGCPVYDHYGAHEIGAGAVECPARLGLHWFEDLTYFEVVDTESGLPVSSGNVGDLVVTSLYREGPPLIRYQTHDLVRVVSEDRCECGSYFRRIDHFLGRSDDMVKLRGVNVYPMACLRAIKSDRRTTGEWMCVVRTAQRGDKREDVMTVEVEVKAGIGDRTGLAEILADELKKDLGVRVEVRLVDPGTLAQVTNLAAEGKPRRLRHE